MRSWIGGGDHRIDVKAAAAAADIANLFRIYLATLTLQAEQNATAQLIADIGINAWLGGNDSASEGDWRWTEGPEGLANGGLGTPFWSGRSSGSSVGGLFENWGSGEPNDSGNEDYLQISALGAGVWNDLPDRNSLSGSYQPRGYVLEKDLLPIFFSLVAAPVIRTTPLYPRY